MNHQSRIAVVSEIADLQVMLAQTQSRMARLMQKVSEWDVPAPQVAASPEPLLAIPRAQDIQGSDQGGESGALRRFGHEPRSEQKTTAEAQGRNEPASVGAVAGAKAGEGDEGSEPPPAPRDRTKTEVVLDLWAEGVLIDREIAERAGSTVSSVRAIVAQARAKGDPRAAKRSVRATAQAIPALLPTRKQGEPPLETPSACDRPSNEGAEINMAVAEARHAAANEEQREIARDFLAKRPAPEPYSKPMEPAEAAPIPAAELPAPVPMHKLDPEIVMFVADGVVHGPDGIEERLTTPQLLILARMADGGMYPDKALCDISGATNGTFTYLMNGMRAKLAGVGVEIFQPTKGFWRARRAS